MHNESQHPRSQDGKFSTKEGTAPELDLDDEGYSDFNLVQPLRRHDWDANKPGMGRFQMPYMGSTEYEIGGQRKSLLRLRGRDEAPETAEHELILKDGTTRTVYFVGQNLDKNIAQFQRWVDAGTPTQELSYFDGALGLEEGYLQEEGDRTAAWWAFTGDTLFTLKEEEREHILAAIADAPKS